MTIPTFLFFYYILLQKVIHHFGYLQCQEPHHFPGTLILVHYRTTLIFRELAFYNKMLS